MASDLHDARRRVSYDASRNLCFMDLKGAAWMVRSHEQSVSCLLLLEDDGLLAGGWDGKVTRWSAEGDIVWTTNTPDRISAFAVHAKHVALTSGLHVVCLDLDTGEEQWSAALEGSADAVQWWEGQLRAISSVYDIEHNDFIESAIWNFSPEGALEWVERMDERPWAMVAEETTLLAGLGRPRCGWLDISKASPFHHTPSPTGAPITCASPHPSGGLFGQADGAVVTATGDALVTQMASVQQVQARPDGTFIVANDEGGFHAFDQHGQHIWGHEGTTIVAFTLGFELEASPSVWLARSQNNRSELQVFNAMDGSEHSSAVLATVNVMTGNQRRCAVGCEDGSVYVWEQGLLQRRMHDDASTSEPVDERVSALQAKLRALRER